VRDLATASSRRRAHAPLDGTDDAGSKLARGVYFVRSSTQRDAKRIIVLNP